MRTWPTETDRDEFQAVVVRTDYTDEAMWRVVLEKLEEPWCDGQAEASTYLIEGPGWDGAGVDEVLGIARTDRNLPIFFIADAMTMRPPHHPLLAVTTWTSEDFGDNEERRSWRMQLGDGFRTLPVGVSEIHTNLALANMDFDEFAEAAQEDRERIFRGF